MNSPSQRPLCLQDVEDLAKQNMQKDVLRFFAAGTGGNEYTLKDNREAFKRIQLRPRMMRGISQADLSTTVLGQTVSMPICVAPTAFQKLAHPDGEIATAKACGKAGICMGLSMNSTTTMEDVAKSAPGGLHWFQLYYPQNRKLAKSIIRRAEGAGYKALLLTVDSPFFNASMQLNLPPNLHAVHLKGLNFNMGSVVSLDDIAWIKSITKLPVVAKGILTATDARLAVEHGVDAIAVSNHGGRQLDGVAATIDALPEVISAVNGQVEVYMDGGVRLGTDVLKALALGARAVFIGRPVIWGLAYEGEQGVSKVLEMIRNELKTAMILSGCSSVNDIPASLVTRLCQCRL